MRVRHYYHVFAGGGWSAPVREHIEALGQSGFAGDIAVGLVGPEQDRFRAREMIGLQLAGQRLPEPAAWIEADAGFEQVTLARVHADVRQAPGEFAVLYAHTKGAYSNDLINEPWRQSMTRHVVSGWRECVRLLEDGYETAGCHWLTPERHHDPPRYPVTTPMYGGNFWCARASYLCQLPPPGNDYRHQAEEWIGLGGPRAADLLPGWPSMRLFAPETAAAR